MFGGETGRGRRGWGRALAVSAVAHGIVVSLVIARADRSRRALPPPRPTAAPPETRVEIDLAELPQPTSPARSPPPWRAGAGAQAVTPAARLAQRRQPRGASGSEGALSPFDPARPGAAAAATEGPRGGVELSLRRDPTATGSGGGADRPADDTVPRTVNRPGFVAHVDPDGTLHFRDKIGGDITDLLMRLAGVDPYAYDKRRFADETRAARQRMGDAARATWRAEALQDLPSMLRRLWRDTSLPVAARRRALFGLWDECLDPPPDETASSDDPTAAGAGDARRAILHFIREHLPAGAPDAFSQEELDALNSRRASRQRFAPYEPPPQDATSPP